MKFSRSKAICLLLLFAVHSRSTVAFHQVNHTSRGLSRVQDTATSEANLGNGDLPEKDHESFLVVVRRSHQQISTSDICGGILVSPRIVITAAHCFYDPYGLYRKFPHRFGVAYRRYGGVLLDVETKALRAAFLVVHPGYREAERLNDIGAMRLEVSVCEGCLIAIGPSIPMALWRSDRAKLEMLVFFIANENDSNIRTERMPARWTSKMICDQAYHRWGVRLNSKQICIETLNPKFSHRGESAILLVNDQPIGVLSYKFDVSSLGNSLPYVYTDLTRYPAFIQQEIHNDATETLQTYRICSSILYVIISMGIVE